ncbi:MAG TPA: 4Fe-4S dicluster domain-containing protein [Firmicutes bacterium]|nr:4Fe-4S dicluster domain-containing protein [Bacillota bacterium]
MKFSEKYNQFICELEENTGQNPSQCFQCAKCSASCPVVSAMDLLPHQVIRYLQLGLLEELLESRTPWICASCFTCAARCPRDLDLARMMEGVRLAILRRREGSRLSPGDLDLCPGQLEKLPSQALVSSFRKQAK